MMNKKKEQAKKRNGQKGNSRIVTFRVSEQEYNNILQQKEELRAASLSDLMRNIVVDKEVKVRQTYTEDPKKIELLRELVFQIRKIGVNINQIAHRVNLGQELPPVFYKWAEGELQKMGQQCKRVLSELEEDFVIRERL